MFHLDFSLMDNDPAYFYYKRLFAYKEYLQERKTLKWPLIQIGR